MSKSLEATVLAGQDMSVSFVSPWVETRDVANVTFHARWSGGTNPTGTLTLEVSNDPVIDQERWTNPAGVSSAQSIQSSSSYLVFPTSANSVVATPGSVMLSTSQRAFKYTRIRYVGSGGGVGTLFQCWVFGNGG